MSPSAPAVAPTQAVQYGTDARYPGPQTHPPPAYIEGIPTQADLDGYPRIFTWGELKGIVRSGDLVHLMRNKELQARYDDWMIGQKQKYGSTEKYLTQARLPWAPPSSSSSPTETFAPAPAPAPAPPSIPTPSAGPSVPSAPHTPLSARFPRPAPAAPAPDTQSAGPASPAPGSGASTPSSAGFVSLDSLGLVDGKLRRARSARSARAGREGQGGRKGREWEDLSAPGSPVSARAGAGAGQGGANGAIKVNGVNGGGESGVDRKDEAPEEDGDEDDDEDLVYLKYDPAKGLDKDKFAVLPNDWPYNVPYGVRHYCVWCRVPIAHPTLVDYSPSAWARIELEGLGGFTGVTPLRPYPPPYLADAPATPPPGFVGTKFFPALRPEDYYTADVHAGGADQRAWAGVTYESEGGREVGRMVRGLWDPRGWETAWFVNPPRLQSVPGFAHFHVFARRKTPVEINASEKAWEEGWRG